MPQIVLGPPQRSRLDGSVKKAAFTFLEKLGRDDTAPGLHIEPINGSVDPRVRTGRVNDFWRAVVVKVQGATTEAHYVYLGTYPHDDAIDFAKRAQLSINPLNGIAELILADSTQTADSTETADSAIPAERSGQELYSRRSAEAADSSTSADSSLSEPAESLLSARAISLTDLTGLGIDPRFAERTLAAATEDDLLALADTAPAQWQAMAVLDVATGTTLAQVAETYALGDQTPSGTDDDAMLTALLHPAAQLSFAFVDDDEELRAAIEDEDFGRWRVFLHPEQRRYVRGDWGGAYRLTGGAGTGKTVVLLHRAREFARRNPRARIVLTTYTRTLAQSLAENLGILDPRLPIASQLGDPGIYVAGIDAIVRRTLVRHADRLPDTDGQQGPVSAVLGTPSTTVLDATPRTAWQEAIMHSGATLPEELRSDAFLEAEYGTVVLPKGITTRAQYLRVRRQGRGVALDRTKRGAVWDVVEAYRAATAASGTTDWDEKAMIGAKVLDRVAAAGEDRPADHVLVDEAQDLAPSRLIFLRSLVTQGPNDLLLAEDVHQRIYGQRVVLSHYDIHVRGRSRRLRLNYRTTAQNLHYAVGVLEGADFVDLDAQAETAEGYRSARRGPAPQVLPFDTLVAQYDGLAQLLSGWLAEGEAPETVGVLVRGRWEAERLQRALSERGLEVRFVDGESTGGTGKPLVMTMHRSKGMEFARVVLFGMSAGAVPGGPHLDRLPEADRQDALLRERSLVYVAATRARDHLVVMWSGEPSDLLPGVRPRGTSLPTPAATTTDPRHVAGGAGRAG